MREKHHVIVPGTAAWAYIANGYERSAITAQDVLASGWGALAESEREGLVVLEIDAEEHERLSRNPRRFAVHFTSNQYLTNIEERTYELLEEGKYDCVVADAEHDVVPGTVPKSDLYFTAQEAVLGAVAEVRSQIELHKAAIQNLETFLGTHV